MRVRFLAPIRLARGVRSFRYFYALIIHDLQPHNPFVRLDRASPGAGGAGLRTDVA